MQWGHGILKEVSSSNLAFLNRTSVQFGQCPVIFFLFLKVLLHALDDLAGRPTLLELLHRLPPQAVFIGRSTLAGSAKGCAFRRPPVSRECSIPARAAVAVHLTGHRTRRAPQTQGYCRECFSPRKASAHLLALGGREPPVLCCGSHTDILYSYPLR